jgi:hypothetical protein
MGGLRRIAIDLFLMAAIGLLLGFIAPFGSAAMPPGPRLFFWVGFIVAGYAIFRPITAVSRWVTAETRVPPWLATVLTVAVASLPLAALVALALGGMRVTGIWLGNGFIILYLQVAVVGAAIRLAMMFLFRTTPPHAAEAPSEQAPTAPDPEASPFLRRLPPHLGRELLCLEMQDHYVRAETAAGSALILMRFRDAVTELGDSGMQVHRSWWAPFAAMEALEREGRSARLRLRGGGTLPVSRAWVPAVRKALARAPSRGFDSGEAAFKSADEAGRSARGARPGTIA